MQSRARRPFAPFAPLPPCVRMRHVRAGVSSCACVLHTLACAIHAHSPLNARARRSCARRMRARAQHGARARVMHARP
eukprot:5739903-Pleurochrysis_carterae.AAC.1